MMAIPRLMAKAYRHHAGCAALAIRKKKIGKLLLVGHFCTSANDNNSQMKYIVTVAQWVRHSSAT